MKTILERFAELPVITVRGVLGEPRNAVDANLALAFTIREVHSNLMELRTSRAVTGDSIPFPEDASVNDFALGIEIHRAIQSAPLTVNPVIAMGAIARVAGADKYQAERARWEAERQQLLAAAKKSSPKRGHRRNTRRKKTVT